MNEGVSRRPTAAEVRREFLEFFRARDHRIVPSSPLVLPADPSLLFVNAGMNQFKEIFLGTMQPESGRVANSQKCIRVSGKHNDLEEVGHDTYHHTFFEMLGNWSFGDYYKEEAIRWAWELLTEVWSLPKGRLWATVYEEDREAERLWKEVTDIDPAHVLRFGKKDNFWEMAETGPCGPCSEIHIDIGDQPAGPEKVNSGSPDVIEIWNLVFIQYNRRADGSLTPLPQKHVDTGMGLERLVAVLQGVRSNYDTDLFAPLIRKVEEISGMKYEGEAATAMRVIADHIRALAFAIADGVLPSNEGRGYVLRRLLRRAVRYGRKLGLKEPFLCDLIPVLEAIMGDDYPELVRHRSRILEALRSEEESFAATLDRGIGLFEEVVKQVAAAGGSVFPGREAFRLYDTYGFPLDLTRLMAEERNLIVDEDEFRRYMEEQRARARAARESAMREQEKEVVSRLVEKGVQSAFCGHETTETETVVVALADDTGLVDCLAEGKEGQILLAETPFYGESGGQVGDRGMIRSSGAEFEVWDTQKPAEGIILHLGKIVQGSLSVGDRVTATVDAERRKHTARHHTATHLLNYALRTIVDPSVKQAGSLVAPDRLRFDFTHYRALSAAQLEEIERLVNDLIQADDEVRTYTMPLKDVPGSGIIAVFDEKYGETVRVVDIGGYSRELCGGTHVRRTGEIGIFKILTESSVAAGVRRIEAVCGRPAYEAMRREHEVLMTLAKMLSVPVPEIPQRVSALTEKVKSLEKQLRQRARSSAEAAVKTRHHSVSGIDVLLGEAGELSPDLLRAAVDRIKARGEASVAVVAGVADGKALFVAWCSPDAVAKGIHAGRLLGKIARIAGGGGGGRPEWAQAGGRNPEKIREALAAVPAIVEEMAAQ